MSRLKNRSVAGCGAGSVATAAGERVSTCWTEPAGTPVSAAKPGAGTSVAIRSSSLNTLERADDERGLERREPELTVVHDGQLDEGRGFRLPPRHLRQDVDRIDDASVDVTRPGIVGPEPALPALVSLVVAARLDHSPGERLHRPRHGAIGGKHDPGVGRHGREAGQRPRHQRESHHPRHDEEYPTAARARREHVDQSRIFNRRFSISSSDTMVRRSGATGSRVITASWITV